MPSIAEAFSLVNLRISYPCECCSGNGGNQDPEDFTSCPCGGSGLDAEGRFILALLDGDITPPADCQEFVSYEMEMEDYTHGYAIAA
jgi:hypothetical protein